MNFETVTRTLSVFTFTALLGACAAPSAPAVLTPNVNLLAQGIPPIPAALVERVARYTDFRGHTFVDWHPVRNEMLVAHRKAGDNVPQIYRLDRPMGELEQLTEGAEPVTSASYEPRDGRYLVFERSKGGDEADQIHRLDLPSRQTTLLTQLDEAHWCITATASSAAFRSSGRPISSVS